jgi:hypothetical protein
MMRTHYKVINSDDASNLPIDYVHSETDARLRNNYAIAPNIRIEHSESSSQSENVFTVIDTFPSWLEARKAVSELQRQGLQPSHIVVITKNYQEREDAINWEFITENSSTLMILSGIGIDIHDASHYENAVKHGKFLVAAVVTEHSASQAQSLLENIGHRVIAVY